MAAAEKMTVNSTDLDRMPGYMNVLKSLPEGLPG
jgi:hypothetical protein